MEMRVDLPQYIPLDAALHRVPLRILRGAVISGKIGAVQVNQTIFVDENAVAAWVERRAQAAAEREALWEKVKHLDGRGIGVEEACQMYGYGRSSIYRWLDAGQVRIVKDCRGGGRGHKRLLNQADLAYIAVVGEVHGRCSGRPILTPEFQRLV